MRDAFSAVKLVNPFLDARQEFDSLSDLVQRDLVRQFTDSFQDKSLLRHTRNMRSRSWGIKLKKPRTHLVNTERVNKLNHEQNV